MIAVIFFLLAFLLLAVVVLLVVAAGRGETLDGKESRLAAQLVSHLNGEAEPPTTLVTIYDDLPTLTVREPAVGDDITDSDSVESDPVAPPPLPKPGTLAALEDEHLKRMTRAWELSVRRRAQILSDGPARGTVQQRRQRERAREQFELG